MKRELYEKLNENVRNKGYKSIFKIINNSLTLAIFVFYPTLLVFLFMSGYEDILKMVIVPLAAFIIVSIARYFINAKRPYEVMNIEPLTARKKSGKSFPSRHVFSIFMIAFCCLHLNAAIGVVLLILAVILSALRVLCGVHFIKDTVAGALTAAVAFIIGFICF